MSTLLKKKYCKEQRTESVENHCYHDGNGDEAIARTELVVVPKTQSPSSPISTTVSNDGDDDDSINDTHRSTLSLSLISNEGIPMKSVRFNDVFIDNTDDRVSSESTADATNDYSELVDKYRNDVWYTVRYSASK
jgi:hypothetical protein